MIKYKKLEEQLMDKTFIVYISASEHSKQYSEMFSDKLKLPLTELCGAAKTL